MTDLAENLKSYLKAVDELRKAEEECGRGPDYFIGRGRDAVEYAENCFLDSLADAMEKRLERRNLDTDDLDRDGDGRNTL